MYQTIFWMSWRTMATRSRSFASLSHACVDESSDGCRLSHYLQNESRKTCHLYQAVSSAVRGEFQAHFSDEVSTKWLDGIIPSLFDQRDYGVSPHDISGSPKIPATLQLKVWELKDVSRWLCPPHYPANMAQALQERRQEREQARKEVLQAVEKMDDVEKLELLKGESESKESKPSSLPEANVEPLVQEEEPDTGAASALNKSLVDSERGRRESTVASTSSRRSASPGKKSKLTPEEVSIV